MFVHVKWLFHGIPATSSAQGDIPSILADRESSLTSTTAQESWRRPPPRRPLVRDVRHHFRKSTATYSRSEVRRANVQGVSDASNTRIPRPSGARGL